MVTRHEADREREKYFKSKLEGSCLGKLERVDG